MDASAVTPDPDPDRARERLSAMLDGDADAAALDAVLGAWRREPQTRECWHTYTLIGDVLRSEDLAQPASHDAAFLARLRGRLAEEPAILAPLPPAVSPSVAPGQAARRAWRRWSAPVAMAAGVFAVAGVAVMVRSSESAAEAGLMAAAPGLSPVQAVQTVAVSAGRPAAPVLATDGVLVRDPQLDRYLEAHRQRSRQAPTVVVEEDSLRQVGVAGR
jgi:sigma-E factor negative regulatory protein RseA